MWFTFKNQKSYFVGKKRKIVESGQDENIVFQRKTLFTQNGNHAIFN